MPTYQYECDACRHQFEILQSITEGKLKKCPACGQLKLFRLIGGGSGIIFKGSGFYETDYKRNAPAQKDSAKEKPAPAAPPVEKTAEKTVSGKNNPRA